MHSVGPSHTTASNSCASRRTQASGRSRDGRSPNSLSMSGVPPHTHLTISGGVLIKGSPDAAFLDEFRMVVSSYDDGTGTPELIVFDTRIPQDHPGRFRRFGLPPRYRHHSPRITIDGDMPLPAVTRDGPISVDPTQAVIVVELGRPTATDRRFSYRAGAFLDWMQVLGVHGLIYSLGRLGGRFGNDGNPVASYDGFHFCARYTCGGCGSFCQWQCSGPRSLHFRFEQTGLSRLATLE